MNPCKKTMYKDRTYRGWVKNEGLVSFEVKERETDLFISAEKKLEKQARQEMLTYRKEIEDYIKKNPAFYSALEPVNVSGDTAGIVKAMACAGKKAGVGPMAAVAGAMAEFVGRGLLRFTDEVIVENGGDIFMKTSKKRIVGIFAGERSPFTGKLALEVGPSENGLGVCTSSGTVSHSLSFGKADAALTISDDAALADAAATTACNLVKTAEDIEKAIDFTKKIDGINGILVIIGDKMGSWGKIKLVQ